MWVDARVAGSTTRRAGRSASSACDHDMTERKRAEEELRAAARRKDEFLAMLAHELRNPLAPVRNGLQVMRLAGRRPGGVRRRRGR